MGGLLEHIERTRHHRQPRAWRTDYVRPGFVRCHCGDPAAYGYDGNPKHTRGMCEACDSARCDAYPGDCAL